MQLNSPQTIHPYESAVHDSFIRSLEDCSHPDLGGLYNPLFLQCIKASGVNFAYSYEQFFQSKILRQKARDGGYRG